MLQHWVNQRCPRSFLGIFAEPEITRSLTVIRKDLSAHRGELSPMLLKTRQHRKIALIQHQTAVPLNTAGARALLLLRSTVLRRRTTAREKRQSARDEYKLCHENLLMQRRAAASGLQPQAPCVQMVPSVLAPMLSGVFLSQIITKAIRLSISFGRSDVRRSSSIFDRDSDCLPQDGTSVLLPPTSVPRIVDHHQVSRATSLA